MVSRPHEKCPGCPANFANLLIDPTTLARLATLAGHHPKTVRRDLVFLARHEVDDLVAIRIDGRSAEQQRGHMMTRQPTEESLLSQYIAERTPLHVWINSGVRLNGVAISHSDRTIVLAPEDGSSRGILLLYKAHIVSVGIAAGGAGRRWTAPDSRQRTSQVKGGSITQDTAL
jgi:hypothetical protein